MFKLITPDKSYQSQWEEIMSEWDDSDKRPRIFFQESYDLFLEKALQLSQGDNIEKSIPKSSLFFLVNEADSARILWFLWLRHHIELINDKQFSWHIGYGVRPSERGKWYATEMLKLGLIEAQKVWIEKLFIACDDDNIASAKVIEANGGILEKYMEKDGVKMRRYWINLP